MTGPDDAPVVPVTAGASSSRARWGRLVKIGFAVAVVAFAVAFVVGRRHEVAQAWSHAHRWWIVVALVTAAAGQWAAVVGFQAAMRAAGAVIPFRENAKVYFVSQLGKYIPGSVWPIVAVTQMGRRFHLSRRSTATGSILAMVFSLVTGGVLGATLVVVAVARRTPAAWWLLLVLPVAVAVVHPRVLVPAVDRLLRLVRRPPLEVTLDRAVLERGLGGTVVSWVLLGLQCWALVVALGAPVWASLAPSVGGFALAYVAGVLFVPAPAGAGVREAVLGLALVSIVEGTARFDHGSVVLVVLLSRVLLAALDFAQAGVVLLAARRWTVPSADLQRL